MNVEDYYTSPVWVAKEGKELNIQDMETSHIQNCIRMLKRNGQNEGIVIRSLCEELDNRCEKNIDSNEEIHL